MATTGSTIVLYNSDTPAAQPTAANLEYGELALNYADGKLFYKDPADVVQELKSSPGGFDTEVQYNNAGSFAGSSNMTFDGTSLSLENDLKIFGMTFGTGANQNNTNIAIGLNALSSNANGHEIVAIGDNALSSYTPNGALARNTAVGARSLRFTTTGDRNTAFGWGTGRSNIDGTQNSFIGYHAGGLNTSGSDNVALGNAALFSNTAGLNNTAVGSASLTNSTGTNNTAIGYRSGQAMTTGLGNVILGGFTGNDGTLNITTANANVVLSDGFGAKRVFINGAGDFRMFGSGATTLQSGTNGQRPGTPLLGMIRYNTDSNSFEGYQGAVPAWSALGGGGGGTVTSVDGSGGTTGLTLTGGPITTSGTLTLGGTLAVANGGTGATTATAARTALGLGTMAVQDANAVAITGGTIDGTSVGATTASTIKGTTIEATTQFTGLNFVATDGFGGNLKNAAGTTCVLWGGGGATSTSTAFFGSVAMNPIGANVTISPQTGGTVFINPNVTGDIRNMVIGAGGAQAGTFTDLAVTGTFSVDGAQGTSGQVLTSAGAGNTPTWTTLSSGTVTSVSVVSANGLAGTVANATTTPAITLSTTVTGILQGNGTAISAASTTGTGDIVLANTPTLITPNIGAATGTSLTVTGNVQGATVTSTSDERLKYGWKKIGKSMLDALAEVKSGTFKRRGMKDKFVGVSAQSLQPVMPEAVIEDAEGYLSVAYGNAALVAAIELAKEVKQLKQEIAELKALLK